MSWGQATLSRLAAELVAGDGPHALAVLDVDGLAAINQSRGRGAGDAVLDDVDRRLANEFADGYAEHWVGDQFLVFLPYAEPLAAAARVREALTGRTAVTPYSLCAGVAISPWHGRSNVELVAAVAKALRVAKLSGPAHLAWPDPASPWVGPSRRDDSARIESVSRTGRDVCTRNA